MWTGGSVDMTADMPMKADILSVGYDRVLKTVWMQEFYLVALVDPDAHIETRQFTMVTENGSTNVDASDYIGTTEMDTRASQMGWDNNRPVYYVFEVKKK